jgi:peroxiredoxin
VTTPLDVRTMAPPFHLTSSVGSAVSPWDYKEKTNLVLFFFDSDCERCIDFLKQLDENHASYCDLNAEVLGISRASASSVSELACDLDLSYPLLSDENGDVMTRYVGRVPSVVVLDRFGEVRLSREVEELGEILDQKPVIDAVELAELECPECGVSTWI